MKLPKVRISRVSLDGISGGHVIFSVGGFNLSLILAWSKGVK